MRDRSAPRRTSCSASKGSARSSKCDAVRSSGSPVSSAPGAPSFAIDHRSRSAARAAPEVEGRLAMVSEDRKGEGLATSLTVADNVTLGDRGFFVTAHRDEQEQRRGSTAPGSARASQRVAGSRVETSRKSRSRACCTKARTLLVDEPTRGIDVEAKAQIYALVDRAASRKPCCSSRATSRASSASAIACMSCGAARSAVARHEIGRRDRDHPRGRSMRSRNCWLGPLVALVLVFALFAILLPGRFWTPSSMRWRARRRSSESRRPGARRW